jgi:hypothetical protein
MMVMSILMRRRMPSGRPILIPTLLCDKAEPEEVGPEEVGPEEVGPEEVGPEKVEPEKVEET